MTVLGCAWRRPAPNEYAERREDTSLAICSCALSTAACTHPGYTHPATRCRVCQGAHHRPAQAAPRPVPERQRGACACCGLPVGAAGPCVPSPAAAAAASRSCRDASALLKSDQQELEPLTQCVCVSAPIPPLPAGAHQRYEVPDQLLQEGPAHQALLPVCGAVRGRGRLPANGGVHWCAHCGMRTRAVSRRAVTRYGTILAAFA